MPREVVPLEEKFWAKVGEPDPTTGCMIWQGYRRPNKAPIIHEGGAKSRALSVHRVAWEFEHGPIPDGLHVLHRCDNMHCVNVEHLFLGTHQDNMQDRNNKERCASGENHGLTTLTEEQVKEIRAAYRPGHITQRELAERYGVHQVTISQIVRHVRWSYVA
jgi:DNA-binding transcriptional regulator YiaG